MTRNQIAEVEMTDDATGHRFSVWIRPGHASADDIARLFSALNGLHIAAGGQGLRFRVVEEPADLPQKAARTEAHRPRPCPPGYRLLHNAVNGRWKAEMRVIFWWSSVWSGRDDYPTREAALAAIDERESYYAWQPEPPDLSRGWPPPPPPPAPAPPPYNHTRGDSALTPCPICAEMAKGEAPAS
jgi:hypothetical protein